MAQPANKVYGYIEDLLWQSYQQAEKCFNKAQDSPKASCIKCNYPLWCFNGMTLYYYGQIRYKNPKITMICDYCYYKK